MADDDIAALPVLSDGKLVGIVTDQDITVRGVAHHIPMGASIRRVMSEDVANCGPEEDIETALALMSREQVRRMPVCNVDREVIGMVTVGDAARHAPDKKDVAEALADICEPSASHCQAVLA